MKFFKNYCAFIALALLCPFSNYAQAPPMGTAYNFAIFTSAGDFHNLGTSTITGDIGTNVGVLDGFPPGIVVGSIHTIDPVTVQAAADLGVAYADLATRTCNNVIGVTLGNDQILFPGVYCTGAASTLNGNLTLDGADDESSIFIFQVNGAFANTVNSTITLINGAKACNIYWQINGAFALLDNSVFKGNALINGAISLHTNSNLEGRALSTAGAVSTESVTVCAHSKPPIVTCPPSLSFACAGDVPEADPDEVVATELCGGDANVIFVSDVITNGDCSNQFSIIRTYNASDVCGNAATCTQSIYVNDSIAPTITCPNNISIACIGHLPSSDVESVTASDNCGGIPVVTVSADSTGTITDPNNYNIYRKYAATDACGNISYCTQVITVNSTGGLSISCPDNISYACAGDVNPANSEEVTASAGCGGSVTITFSPDVISNQTCANSYTITRTYTATDATGNSVSCDQTITISDEDAPTITCPEDVTVGCSADVPDADTGSISTEDNCGGTVTVTVDADVITDVIDIDNYTILRTYHATDSGGNTSDCTQTITVSSDVTFAISCPDAITVSCASEVPDQDIESVVVTTSCGGSYAVTVGVDVITPGNCANAFGIVRTYTATDGQGNSVSCTQSITVFDDIDPEMTCPDDITVACPSEIPDADVYSIIATDNCDGAVVVTVGQDAITDYVDANHYTVLRTYQATDVCGNIATCIQYIVVSGGGQFTITCPGALAVSCASEVPSPDINSVTINASCGGNITVTVASDVISNLTCQNNYTITRTYTATDVTGYSVSCDQTITVSDNIAPLITCPATVTVSCALNVPPANVNSIVATDNCGSALTITVAPDVITSLGCVNRYQISRTYTATDVCGNSSNCTQIINVFDNDGPVISIPPAIANISCGDPLPVQVVLTATDNCSGATVTPSIDPYIVNACQGYPITYRWTAFDECGNITTATRTFQVLPDTKPPIITPINPNLISGTTNVNCQNSNPNWNPFPYTVADVSAVDVCSNVSVSYKKELLATGECGVDDFISKWLLTWTATDDCGNAGVFTVTLNIVDVTPPVFDSLPMATMSVDCSNIPAASIITATDECGDAFVTMSEKIIQGDCTGNYTIERTYKASTGDCDYKNYFTQIIHVIDNTPPVISFNNYPGNNYQNGDTVDIDCEYLSALQLNAANVTVSDFCSTALAQFDMNYNYAENCASSGFLYNVRAVWTAKDDCGNVGEFVLNYKVSDHTPPQLSNIPANICASQIPSIPTNIIATDNCGSVKIAFNETLPVMCENNLLVQRTWTATDDCGNIARDSQLIIIKGSTSNLSFIVNIIEFKDKPDSSEIFFESIIGHESGMPNITAENIIISNSCLDENKVEIETKLINSGDCIVDGYMYEVQLTITVTDICGNSATLTYFVKMTDTTPPSIDAPAFVKMKCGESVPYPQVTDNSNGALTVSFVDKKPIITLCINESPFERMWTASDNCGNTSNFMQIVTIVDDQGPVLTGIPKDDCGSATIPPVVTARDACSGLDYPVTFTETEGNTDCGKVIIRTWTATDNCGNISIDAQRIFNRDLIAPVIKVTNPDLIKLQNGGTFELACDVEKIPNMLAYYGVNAVSASDNCGGYVDLKLETKLLDEGNCKADGYIAKYLYIWTAIDPCGNESTFELTGKFIDNTAPVFENIPQDITLYCNDVMPEFKTINATDCYLDNMTKQQILVQTVDNSTAYNRIWTATDLCGNTSTAIQIITIKGSGHSCNINLPEGPISCASIDNIITSTITGGQGPFTYEWELVNCDGYISGGQGTDNIKVVNGYTVVNISLKVKDAKGCVSYCTASFDCVEGNDVVGDLINGHEIIQSVTANKTTLNATISIFPNPAIDVFQVTAESYTGEYVVVQVIDILGKIIKSEVLKEMPYKGIEINLHDQAEGIYLVNILKSGHEPLMKKVMIIHK